MCWKHSGRKESTSARCLHDRTRQLRQEQNSERCAPALRTASAVTPASAATSLAAPHSRDGAYLPLLGAMASRVFLSRPLSLEPDSPPQSSPRSRCMVAASAQISHRAVDPGHRLRSADRSCRVAARGPLAPPLILRRMVGGRPRWVVARGLRLSVPHLCDVGAWRGGPVHCRPLDRRPPQGHPRSFMDAATTAGVMGISMSTARILRSVSRCRGAGHTSRGFTCPRSPSPVEKPSRPPPALRSKVYPTKRISNATKL
ncbi:uncharacterized protein LOC123395921 [Hordeum vulgare subsp. vulgare]|uniref:uncharacterized protein LOC123395921 n=1 Tax=Hordeum vulgare subsp. vulgare TaxID=112509 RepID=UPI001D1A4A1F|nr:uncharacterized protein LOC123395921 [Hordeum vulgare subsp. vulgare]